MSAVHWNTNGNVASESFVWGSQRNIEMLRRCCSLEHYLAAASTSAFNRLTYILSPP